MNAARSYDNPDPHDSPDPRDTPDTHDSPDPRDTPDTHDSPDRRSLSRRRFLQSLAAAGAVTAGGGALIGLNRSGDGLAALSGNWSGGETGPAGETAPAQTGGVDPAPGRRLPGAVDGRVLVVINLEGGNDGLSTLIPAGDPRYHDYRPNLAVPDDEVLALDDEVGLHPALHRLHRRGITTVEGVGPIDGDLSHFAMTQRWERGDATGVNNLRTGFLGRLADALDDRSPLVGVSMQGPTAHLLTDRAATLSLNGPDDLWFLEPNDWVDVVAYQRGLDRFGGPGWSGEEWRPGALLDATAASYRELSTLAVDLAERRAAGNYGNDDQDSDEYWERPMIQEGGQLGRSLSYAAELIAADVGVRVVYAADGSYDTHQGHSWEQQDNLSRLDAAVDGFLAQAEDFGFADRVLVATISEFGRRVPESDSGLDHGAASTMVVAGPVGDRRLGQRPALDDLDDDDNLRVAIGFDRYLAGLAQDWLGVEAASVLPGEPEPLALL